jgi:hypothetical protein
VLGSFSTIQKAGKQAKAQGQFALMGSFARVIMPVVSGYMEEYVEKTSSFSIVLIMMAISLIGISLNYNKIIFFTGDGGQVTLKSDNLYSMNKIQVTLIIISLACVAASIGAISDWGHIDGF